MQVSLCGVPQLLNDIAVIKLKTKLVFGRRVLPIALPKINEETPPNSNALILGWGSTKEYGPIAYKLRKVNVPVVDRNKCRKKYFPAVVSSSMICAGLEEGGKDACQGDSGGPMVVRGKLVGITSWGNGCAYPGYPGVYTEVSKFRRWIKRNANL